jgi:phosphoglycolate phosphatase
MTTTAPAAVLFDWDNTLIDSWPSIIHAMNETLVAMGHAPWTEAECHARIGRSMREAFPELFGDRWHDARTVFQDSFAAIHLDMLVPLPGAEAMLADFVERGIYLGVVSNKTGKFLRTEAQALGWDRYFGRLIGAGDAARDKPAPDPVHMALEGSGVTAGESVWFAGDALVDMQCGADSGCPAVLIHPNPANDDAFPGCAPRLVFRGCEGFHHFVRNLPVPKRDEQ